VLLISELTLKKYKPFEKYLELMFEKRNAPVPNE
jgi:hypothetical protein